MIDLLVVGAGPVGLVTAIHAAQAGLEVTVIESRAGTIDKACGEGLMPATLEHLIRIGVNPPGMDFMGIRYISGDRTVDARFSKGPGRGVRRTTLHDSLRQRATELKIKFVYTRVNEVVQNSSFVEAAGIHSRFLIGADGLHSNVRNQIGLGIVGKYKAQQRYGIRQHFDVKPWSDFVEVYWSHLAEVYVTPVDHRTVGVAVLGNSKLNFEEIISNIPRLAQHLTSAQSVSKLRGAGPLYQHVDGRTVGRVLLVGDASGYIDALTGEGMRVGFAEAEAAVRAVVANDPKSYEIEWQRITRSYRWLAIGMLWAASKKSIRPMIVPSAQALPTLFRRLVNALG